ncbi:MAG: hypothetical protein WBL63_01165 [Candidatus Acidiferrum sp.]
MNKEATKPAAGNFLQQQARFDKFIEVFNNERPHEALDMKCPADVYQPSPRPYTACRTQTSVWARRKSVSARSLLRSGRHQEVHDDIWLVNFMDHDLGYFDLATRVLEPLENPFGPKVLPMS